MSSSPTAPFTRSENTGPPADVGATRALIDTLLQSVPQSERQLDGSDTARLLEVNEQLIVSALRAQTAAEETVRALADLSHLAGHDPLTGLPNRVLFADRLEVALTHARRHRGRLALLFLDLNDFKLVNDNLGHARGDEALKQVANALTASVRAGDTVSRHGGDEFLVLLAEVTQPADAILVADKIIAALGRSGRKGDQDIRMTVSVGVSIYPADGEDARSLIECADTAMYRAKQRGGGSYVYHGDSSVSEQTLQLPALQWAGSANGAAAPDQSGGEHSHRRQADILAAVAKELRNPLWPLRIATAMFESPPSDQPLLPHVKAILELQLGNLSRLIDHSLNQMRIDNRDTESGRRDVPLITVVEEAVAACRPAIDVRAQKLDVQLPAVALRVTGDSASLRQALRNLLDNASKYSANGGQIGLLITVTADEVAFRVTDSGIGLAAEALSRLLQPALVPAEGTGLGLRVVREFVAEHRGKVTATSAGKERGSEFVVTLPLADQSRIRLG